jgi:hypothetical protein
MGRWPCDDQNVGLTRLDIDSMETVHIQKAKDVQQDLTAVQRQFLINIGREPDTDTLPWSPYAASSLAVSLP